MDIAVFVKQVPDTDQVHIDPETHTLVREGVEAVLNPFDYFAVEEALRLREAHGGSVTAISMGPPQAEKALRECLTLGADRAILLTDRAFAGGDTWATSLVLARALAQLPGTDVALFGKQAADGDTAQVGPGVAAHIDWPQATYVRHIREVREKTLVVERLLDAGSELIEIERPCVLSVIKEINEPRIPTLAGKLASVAAPLDIWDAGRVGLAPDQVGLAGSPTQVMRIFTPTPRTGGQMFEGSAAECVEQLVAALKPTVLDVCGMADDGEQRRGAGNDG